MRQIMLISNLILFTLFAWTCNEAPPLDPESQDLELSKRMQVGTVTPILSLDPGNSPEGIAIDWCGNMYVSNTRGANRSTNEILKFTKNGDWEIYARLPGGGHATGLTTDWRGNVYSAFATDHQNTNGVYIIKRNRHPKRLKGSEHILAPNSLVFDWRGNLYVTDSEGGAIWKYGKNRKFEKWLDDPLLKGGIVPNGPPFPLPGANGIAFYPPNKLYVANTAYSNVSCIKINYKKNKASISKVGEHGFLLMNIDGIAVDIHENVYAVMPTSTLSNMPKGGPPPGVPPLAKLNPKTGEVTPIIMDITHFDTPTSLAFGRGWGNWGSIYIANANLQYGQPPNAGPGVVKVKVGVFGLGKK